MLPRTWQFSKSISLNVEMEKTGLHPIIEDNFQNATTLIQEKEKLMLKNLLTASSLKSGFKARRVGNFCETTSN